MLNCGSVYGETQALYDGHNHVDDNKTVIVAYEHSTPVGCGCFKQYDSAAAEVKLMFVVREKRGEGIATAILNELGQWAGENGYDFDHSSFLVRYSTFKRHREETENQKMAKRKRSLRSERLRQLN